MNRYDAVVESCSARDGHAWLKVGRGRLAARLWPGIEVTHTCSVRIAPHDVVLCLDHPGRTSARNVIPGHVRRVRETPEGNFVVLDVGFELTALVTSRAVADLGLRRGTPVYAMVKATAIEPDATTNAAFRVSLAGADGWLEHEHIAFLRAIAANGSLSAAAREAGVQYRTAWARAQLLNRRWGEPLVARIVGGKGGGGTSLTAAGMAVLRLAEDLERPRA